MIDYVKVLHKNPLQPQAPQKTYAQFQSRETLNLNDLSAHMAEHGCPFSRGTIRAVLTDAISCVEELVLGGNIVKMGELGKFYVSLRSDGVCESIVDRVTGKKPVFTADNITAVRMTWAPSSDMKNLRSKATFNEVQTRAAQALDLKQKHTEFVDGSYVADSKREGGVQVVE